MSADEIATNVRQWLEGERMEIREQKDERSHLHLLCKYPAGKNGHMFAIVIPKGRDLLAISSMTRVDGGQQNSMQKLIDEEEDEWVTWAHDCRMQLIASGADWAIHMGHSKKKAGGPLQAFNVSEPIWFDGLTKNELMQTLRRLWMAKLGVILEIKYTFGPGSGKAGPVDDWAKKQGQKRTTAAQKAEDVKEVHTDDSMSFGTGFDPSEWV